MKPNTLPFILFCSLITCAPINEDECKRGNWAQIGLQDGRAGAPISRIETYRQECAQYGVAVDKQAWLSGREQGLQFYCTPSNAYKIGKSGQRIKNLCPNMNALTAPNSTGLRIHDIEERIDELKDEKRNIRQLLAREYSGELSPEAADIRRRYLRLMDDLDDEIDDLEREVLRLDKY